MNANLTLRGGGGCTTAGFWNRWQLEGLGRLSRYYAVSQGILGMLKKHFQNSCYHCNLPLLYFNIHHYSVEGQDLTVQLDISGWIAVELGEERR